MSEWTGGYVADIGYTFGYYPELNPLRLRFAFLEAGVEMPEIGTACELGFGQGVSANIHAAASVTQWWGTDFNPSQAHFAQELAKVAQTDAKFFDDSFEEFFSRQDLPDFDFIGLHGIWSWVSERNRELIADFIRRKLKVGGVVYVSYNTLSNWAAFLPIRALMKEHADVLGSKGVSISDRIEGSLAFINKLMATNPLFAKANPGIAEKLISIQKQGLNYLAHEFFNSDWHPMQFSKSAKLLESAKLNYVCSAHYKDHIDALNLSHDHKKLLEEISDLKVREDVRDLTTNQSFRRDYWVKGLRKLTQLERLEKIRLERLVLVTPPEDIVMEAVGSLGKVQLNEDIYNLVISLLSDYKIKTFGFIEESVKIQGIQFGQVVQVIMILIGNGHIYPAQDDVTISKCKQNCQKINQKVLSLARSSEVTPYLASPVVGGAISIDRLEQLFILCISQGGKTPDDWANFAALILKGQGQKILKDGKALNTDADNLQELKTRASKFNVGKLVVAKALLII